MLDDSTTLRLGVLADVHYSVDPDERGAWINPYDFATLPARMDRALGWFAAERVDTVILAGDLTHRGDIASLQAVLRHCLAGTNVPLLVVGGNHDIASRVDILGEEVARTGSAQLRLAQPDGDRHGNLRLAGLQLAGSESWFAASVAQLPDIASWHAEPAIVVSHFPLLSQAEALAERGLPYPGDVVQRAAIAQPLIDRDGPTVVLSGHIHCRTAQAEGSLLQLTQSALIEPPYDAAIVDVAAQPSGALAVSRRTHRTGAADGAFEPALADVNGAWSFSEKRWHQQ